MEKEKKYEILPIGTVVLLKDASKRLMITGFMPIADEKEYDYRGCLYPEGYLIGDETFLFNHDQIDEIYHEGLHDEETEQYNQLLIEIKENS